MDKDTKVIIHGAKIGPGSSGGPLFDRDGNLIGLNTLGAPGTAAENISVSADYIVLADEKNIFISNICSIFIGLLSFSVNAHPSKHKPLVCIPEEERSKQQLAHQFCSSFN